MNYTPKKLYNSIMLAKQITPTDYMLMAAMESHKDYEKYSRKIADAIANGDVEQSMIGGRRF